MADEATLKASSDQTEGAAEAADLLVARNPSIANIDAAIAAWRAAFAADEALDGLTERDACRLADAYVHLAAALRRSAGDVADEIRALETKAAEAYLRCADRHLAGDPQHKPPIKADPAAAAKALRKRSQVLVGQADDAADDCEMGDAYYAAAVALREAARAEPNATDSISDLKHAAELFRKAGACFEKCGDGVADDDPLHAHGAYHKAVLAYAEAERAEGVIEGYYAPNEPAEDSPDNPRTQHGKAAKRKKDDAKHRGDAGAKEGTARKKYLESGG